MPVVVDTFNVEEPEPITDDGLKLAVAFTGTPLALNATVPLNPPDAVTVTVYFAALPLLMLRLPGEAVMVKSPVDGAVTTSVAVVVCVRVPSVPLMVKV